MVIEAMKMEMEIKAPCDGTVTMSVAQGDKFNTGDTLATVG
jgi:biotin carboxyl carrier protein